MSATSTPAHGIIRLVVGSANLTNTGYRTNIEVGACIDVAPGASAEAVTVVWDAVAWLEQLISRTTDQVTRQLRDIKSFLPDRPATRQTNRFRFVGLSSTNRLPRLAGPGERIDALTIASPFWPSGDDLSDVVTELARLVGGRLGTVRLIGPAVLDEKGHAWPAIPAALLQALLNAEASVKVAAADPSYGCTAADEDDEGEFDEIANRRESGLHQYRPLHAKALLAVGNATTRLAVGSFNLTRKGLGLVDRSNAEAGLLWTLSNDESSGLEDVVAFGTSWREVTQRPDAFVVEPTKIVNGEGGWPDFILSLRATRDQLLIEGHAATWPSEVVIRMRDIRSRLCNQEQWFDPWTVRVRQPETDDEFLGVCSR